MHMLDRTVAPPFVQGTSFDLIKPITQKLGNGTDVLLIPGGSQDVLKIELIYDAGRWFESELGTAYFTAHLLSKGTRTKNSFEIAQLFDQYGAHVEVSPGLDFVSISLYALTKNLEPALALFFEILSEPVFPAKELEQMSAIYVQNLKINLEKTSFLASKHFRKNLFGEDHPYGQEVDEGDIKTLTRDHLENYFKTNFQAYTVFVSGKIDTKTELLIQNTFEKIRRVVIQDKTHALASPPAAYSYYEREESVQSSIRLGSLNIGRKHPDYPLVIFASHVLGGYFGSRLMKNIREEKGLTYGIYSSVHPLRHASYAAIGADVNKENIDITFSEIRKELLRLRSEKIGNDELTTARNHFVGSLQSEITTPFAHADKLKTIYLFDLSPDYYQDMINSILSATPEDLMIVAEKYLNEEKFLSLAVG